MWVVSQTGGGVHNQNVWQAGLILASMIATMPMTGAQARQGEVKSWLDKPLSGWNISGREIPKAPTSDGVPAAQCAGARLADSPEDRAITAKGWKLLGPQQRFGQTLLVSANANEDGQCRPLDYQDFVFVRGLFVGTVSPLPMNSRADGAGDVVRFTSESTLVAEFRRYAASDPLCCPSRTSFVTYEIEERNGKRILVPRSIQTVPR
jgi:hypothetical protein